MKKYVVALHTRDDLPSFYDDMETSGGSARVPNREVPCQIRKATSRGTVYELTEDEAEELRQDDRVYYVRETKLERDAKCCSRDQVNVDYDKEIYGTKNSNDSRSWSIWRHRNKYLDNQANIDGWRPYFPTFNPTNDIFTTSQFQNETGKNVDVIIMDGHIDPTHPDLQVNQDGTGGSRVVQYNWHVHTPQVLADNPGISSLYVLTANYNYAPYTSTDATTMGSLHHGASCAGVACGSRHGMAPKANIYNWGAYNRVQRNSGNVPSNGSLFPTEWEYIRLFHINKPINPETGVKNPTIVNCSFGFDFTITEGSSNWPNYAVNAYTGAYGQQNVYSYEMTDVELEAAQIIRTCDITGTAPNRTFYIVDGENAYLSDIEDAIAAGVHICIAASNDTQLMKKMNSSTYTNTYFQYGTGATYNYHNRSFGNDDCWLIGCLSGTTQSNMPNGPAGNYGEVPVWYTNRGEGVDVYCFGDGTIGATNKSTFSASNQLADDRDPTHYNRTFNGTSSATPVFSGMLACILERYPDMTPAELREYVNTKLRNRDDDFEIGDDGRGWPGYQPVGQDFGSNGVYDNHSFEANENPKTLILTGDIRPAEGYVTKPHNARPASGAVYPRERRAKTGRRVV